MPLKINAGVSRKVGEPNYGSRGASINLELELDARVVGEPARVRERMRELFRLAREAVDEELTGNGPSPDTGGARGTACRPQPNGRQSKEGNGSDRPATSSQVRAIHAIANRQQLDLTRLLQSRFGLYRVDALTLPQASQLIDELNGAADNATGGRR